MNTRALDYLGDANNSSSDNMDIPFTKRYTINVMIFKELQNGFVYEFDKARKITKVGRRLESKYRLRKKKKEFMLNLDQYEIMLSRYGKDFIILFTKDDETFVPVRFETKDDKGEPILRPIDSNLKMLHAMNVEQAYARWNKKSTLEVLMPVIVIGVMAVAVTIVLWTSVQGIIKLNEEARIFSSVLTQASENLMDAVQMMITQKAIPTPPPS